MKTYYLTLSQVFPSTHPRAGEPTYFRENLRRSKLHTIRANYEFWRKRFENIAAGEAILSIREWVGKPYGKGSTQREIVRLTREDGIGIQKLEFEELSKCYVRPIIDGRPFPFDAVLSICDNDGLSLENCREWFKCYDLSKPMAIIHFTNFRY